MHLLILLTMHPFNVDCSLMLRAATCSGGDDLIDTFQVDLNRCLATGTTCDLIIAILIN